MADETVGDLHPARVPEAEAAYADPRKFTDYLLSETHTDGRGKAKFFREIGYDLSNWEELYKSLLAQLPTVEGRYSRPNPPWGENYEAVLRIEAPVGTVNVRTFWEVHPMTGTKFLTAYPLEP